MARALLTMFVLAATFVGGFAIVCDYRTGTSASTAVILQQNCTAASAFCYSYSNYGSTLIYAGCSNSGTCTLPSCVYCTNANRCNTATPSAISCYTRSSTSSDNGTETACSTGISKCFTLFSASGYAGCGNCTSAVQTNYGCRECSSNLCNAATPSSISCYTRTITTSSTSNGTLTDCPNGATSCYSHSDGEAGCGVCTTSSTSSYGCKSCSTNNCNYRNTTTSSSLTCYSNSGSSSRSTVSCSTSCYSYSYYVGLYLSTYAGCGSCTTYGSMNTNCKTCYTNFCNSASATVAGISGKITAASAVLLLLLMKLL